MGASAGVGLACARAFAESGAELLLSDIDGPALNRVAHEVGGGGLLCDVSSEASVAIFAAEVERSFAPPNILINAAGRSYVRALGTMRVSRALLPMMKRTGGRKDIVNIADMNADEDDCLFPYAASTRAFASLADALDENVRGTAVVVTTIMPWDEQAADYEDDGDAPARPMPALRRFACDTSACEAFAAKLVAAVDATHGNYPARTAAGSRAASRGATSGRC